MSSASTSTPERFPALPWFPSLFPRLSIPNEAAWRGSFYPRELRSADYLGHYGGIFNAVEGNTTFYARPSAETVRRWAETMPAGFRFCAKFPRDISHEGDLRERLEAAGDFLELLAPLGERVSPLWLQLSAAFTRSAWANCCISSMS